MKKYLIVLTILLYPAIMDACPMCQGETSKNMLAAYRGITLLLALLPVLGGAGIFYWLYSRSRRFKEIQKNEEL